MPTSVPELPHDKTTAPPPANWEKLWQVHGKCYDLTNFVDSHPGGALFIMSGKGRDCTEMFESYHAMGIDKARKILNKYYVCDVPKYQPNFVWLDDGFYSVLRNRVREHFGGKSHKGTTTVAFKFIFLTLFYLFCAYHTIVRGNFLAAFVAGALHTMLGLNNIHDGSHSAFSTSHFWNRLCSLHMNLIGGSDVGWMVHHVIGHHAHTCVEDKDPDASNFYPLIRQSANLPFLSHHIFQHFYAWFVVYPLVSFGITHTQVTSMRQGYYYFKDLKFGELLWWGEVTLVAITKSITEVVYFLLPFYYSSPLVALGCIIVMWGVSGLCFSFAFLPNHQVKEVLSSKPSPLCTSPSPVSSATGSVQLLEDWGAYQTRTSCNHSTTWPIFSLWVGGINLQIEHHLFPAMSPAFYCEISPIVRKTCKEFGVDYICYDNLLGALGGHFSFLRKLASPSSDEPSPSTKKNM